MLSGQSFNNANKNAAAHESLITFFHGFQVAVTMTVMFNIVQYGYWTVLNKRRNVRGHWNKFGSVYILLTAAILTLVQPIMILIIGSWAPSVDPPCGTDKDHNPLPGPDPRWPCTNTFWTSDVTNTFFPNRWQGWMVQIFCTWGGYLLMMIGVFQVTDMVRKLKKQWADARG